MRFLESFARTAQLVPGMTGGGRRVVLTPMQETSCQQGYRPDHDGALCEQSGGKLHSESVSLSDISVDRDLEFEFRLLSQSSDDTALIWQLLGIVYAGAEEQGGLLLHGGIAARGDEGVLILGPSGAGKSTCLRRIPPPWRALCDDEVLVVRDGSARYRLHPFPTWGELGSGKPGSSWKVQEHVSLKAVFLLEQCEPGEKEATEPFGAGLASVYFFRNSESMWVRYQREPDQQRRNYVRRRRFENCCELSKTVICYRLRATRDGEFWTEIAKVL